MNARRAAVAVLAAVPILALLAFGFSRDPREIPTPLRGHPAAPFALEVFAPGEAPLTRPVGDTIRLGALTGKVVVVNFWASWCLACRDEHAALSETARSYAGRPVEFVGVLYNDATAPAIRWIADMGGQSYPSVTDRDARTAIDYGLYGVPETFIIDQTGTIAHKQIGPVTERLLRFWIDSLLSIPPVPADARRTQ